MKQIFNWLKTNKTMIAGIITAGLAFATAKGFIDTDTGILVTGLAAALGISLSKDKTDNGIASSDIEYPQMTEEERLKIEIKEGSAGMTVYQIDAVVGYYVINIELRWEYVGTRPPRARK